MKVCLKCNTELEDDIKRCPSCGYIFPIVNEYVFNQQDIVRFLSKKGLRDIFYKDCSREIDMTRLEEEYSEWFRMNMLSIVVPIFGFIYYFQYKNYKRKHANDYLTCGLWGIVFWIILIVLLVILLNVMF